MLSKSAKLKVTQNIEHYRPINLAAKHGQLGTIYSR